MKKLASLSALVFFCLGLGGAALSSSQQDKISPVRSVHSNGPTTNYDAAVSNGRDVLRFRRGEKYTVPDGSLPVLGEDSDNELYDLPNSNMNRSAYPFRNSDAVVIGEVIAGQGYLSNDKRDIYSEFKVLIKEVVTSSETTNVHANDSIDVQRKGGTIQLPSGKKLVRGNIADSMPQVGGRYLFFLKSDPDTYDYSILMGYQLVGNEVYRMDDLKPGDSNYSQPSRDLHREGLSETRFLTVVRQKLAQGKGEEL